MLRKRRNSTFPSPPPRLAPETFLRSINLRFDASHPERIAHFQPTSKCVTLLRALLGGGEDRAYFVVAPYGSGKSLTAAYLLHLIENRPESNKVLRVVEQRLRNVSPELASAMDKRRNNRRQYGMVLALHGQTPSVTEGLQAAAVESLVRLGRPREAREFQKQRFGDLIAFLQGLSARARAAGCDRLTIIWDEFGRHVQSVLAEGRCSQLLEIQTLAEFASRSKDMPTTIGVLLHQGVLHQTTGLSQSLRTEWMKIEGRFKALQYVDDSKEIYRLLAEVVRSRRVAGRGSPSVISSVVDKCEPLDIFRGFAPSDLAEILKSAYPLDPATVFLLPRVSGRVAQNERTLFSFLYGCDLSKAVTPEDVYDYFSAAMRADTSVGGTYRQWLETESAISKVGTDPEAVRALKTACLLALGASGERSRASKDLLLFALHGYTASGKHNQAVRDLIHRKLLLYRRHSDEISVWHGTDADLRGRLEEEKERGRPQFRLLASLSKEVPLPTWRPLEYNSEFGVRRFLPGEYHSPDALKSYLENDSLLNGLPTGSDGKVIYVVAQSADELDHALALTKQRLKNPRVLVAIPSEPLPFLDAALEVSALQRMQADADLLQSDPLISTEIQQMADDARAHLQRIVDRLVHPAPGGPRWFGAHGEIRARSAADLRRAISEIMRGVYSSTPAIHNEMIVRDRPSAIVVNARKKLVMGILERSGQDHLGITGNFPDSSMFRTVLLNTGIYRQAEDGRWCYAAPHTLQNPALKQVWQRVREFFTAPGEQGKSPKTLFDELREPPFGIRAGLLPILFAAGLKAFPSSAALTRDGVYLDDILPSEIEDLCRCPERYRLTVLDLDEVKVHYLRGLHKCFSSVTNYEAPESDLIRLCFDGIQSWKAQLPPAALSSRSVSEPTRRLQALLTQVADPVRLLLVEIPRACALPIDSGDGLLNVIRQCRVELQAVVEGYARQAEAALRHVLQLDAGSAVDSIRQVADRWIRCFPDTLVEQLSEGIAKGLVSRLSNAYPSDDALIDSLSSLLVGRSIGRWDDATAAAFERALQDVAHRIEEAAFRGQAVAANRSSAKGLARLIQARMADLYTRLAGLLGRDEAAKALFSIPTTITEGQRSGDDDRSSGQPRRHGDTAHRQPIGG